MAPRTSSSDCAGCIRLAEKISELEERISKLHQIRDAEIQMDTIILAAPSLSQVHDAATSCPADVGAAGLSEPEDSGRPPAGEGLPQPPPALEAGSRLGARPKVPATSTPAQPEPGWSRAGSKRRGGRRHHSKAPQLDIDLHNRFDFLDQEEFPPLDDEPRSRGSPLRLSRGQSRPEAARVSPPSGPNRPAWTRRSTPVFTPAPQRSSSRRPPRPSPLPLPTRVQSSTSPPQVKPPPQFNPSTLIIGDSIVRDVRLRGGLTLSFSGATVLDILTKLPDIITSNHTAHTLVLHVGTNDISKHQSEILKQDFLLLLKSVTQLHSNVSISGPTPTCNRGSERFTRLLGLNTWLASACALHSVAFIDNFNSFWNRGHLFRADGLHLNTAGSRQLSNNISYHLLHLLSKPTLPSCLTARSISA